MTIVMTIARTLPLLPPGKHFIHLQILSWVLIVQHMLCNTVEFIR